MNLSCLEDLSWFKLGGFEWSFQALCQTTMIRENLSPQFTALLSVGHYDDEGRYYGMFAMLNLLILL